MVVVTGTCSGSTTKQDIKYVTTLTDCEHDGNNRDIQTVNTEAITEVNRL